MKYFYYISCENTYLFQHQKKKKARARVTTKMIVLKMTM